ncbi:exoribonuclease R [Leminorella grimontii]|nr:exoribonuclease R [Leminorella grimontii]
MDERKIDFALVSSERRPRGEGKTEKEKAKRSARRSKSEGYASDTGVRVKPPRKPKVKNDEAGSDKASKGKGKKPSAKTKKITAALKSKRAKKAAER